MGSKIERIAARKTGNSSAATCEQIFLSWLKTFPSQFKF